MTLITLPESYAKELGLDDQEPKKKKARKTLSSRSMDLLRKEGWFVDRVEQDLRFPERKNGVLTGKMIVTKRDLFNVADLACIRRNNIGTLYVQVTDFSSRAAHVKKILEAPITVALLMSKNRMVLHDWKARTRGGVKHWELAIHEFVMNDFEVEVRRIDKPEKVETPQKDLPLLPADF